MDPAADQNDCVNVFVNVITVSLDACREFLVDTGVFPVTSDLLGGGGGS